MNSVGLNACGILEFLVLDLSSLQDGIQVCHFVRSEVDRQYVFLSGSSLVSSLASECSLPVCAEMANYRDWDLDQEEVYLLTQIIEIESVAHALRMLSFVVTHMDHAVSMMEGASSVGMEHIRAV